MCDVSHTADFGISYSFSWATFALLFDADGYCVDAPPIARWCIGKDQNYLARYWARRGARVEVLP